MPQHRHTAPWCCCGGIGTWEKGWSSPGAPDTVCARPRGPSNQTKLQPRHTSITRTDPAPGTSVLVVAGQGLERSRLFSAAATQLNGAPALASPPSLWRVRSKQGRARTRAPGGRGSRL